MAYDWLKSQDDFRARSLKRKFSSIKAERNWSIESESRCNWNFL